MNFTREPIIETIITPKEGYKLLVRCSKGGSGEEYSVDAVEVVSFGQSFFFRSQERPKSFLVPVSDYEIIEVKETRVVLKSASIDKAIKIGGGKVAPPEQVVQQAPSTVEQRLEKKRERRRHRRRRGTERAEEGKKEQTVGSEPAQVPLIETPIEGAPLDIEPPVVQKESPPPTMSRLIPPPTQLISETLVKVRDAMLEASEEPSESEEEKPKSRKIGRRKLSKEEEETEGEAGEMKRISTEVTPQASEMHYSIESDFYPPFGSDLF